MPSLLEGWNQEPVEILKPSGWLLNWAPRQTTNSQTPIAKLQNLRFFAQVLCCSGLVFLPFRLLWCQTLCEGEVVRDLIVLPIWKLQFCYYSLSFWAPQICWITVFLLCQSVPLLAQCNLICVCECVEGWREAGEELAWLVGWWCEEPWSKDLMIICPWVFAGEKKQE
jgi:hypothetical protein